MFNIQLENLYKLDALGRPQMETRTLMMGLTSSYQVIHEYDFEADDCFEAWEFNSLKMRQFAYIVQGNILYLTGGIDGMTPSPHNVALAFHINEEGKVEGSD